MKRIVFLSVVLAVAFAAVAATTLPRDVRNVLLSALTNEREAAARYDVFAKKADEEGFRGAAALFRAQAQAERTHAERFAELLRANEVPLPAEQNFTPSAGTTAEQNFTPSAGTTAENLRNAAALERAERDGSYREAVETCNLHGAADVAKVFDQTRDTEVEHANLCNAAARDVDSMKEPKTFYVCGKCGYTTDVKLPFCPSCMHKHAPEAIE